MLENYEAPPIDDAVDEELREWIEQKEGLVPRLGLLSRLRS